LANYLGSIDEERTELALFEPVVSVVMSVYDGEAYIKHSIESILHQTLSCFEFIIINDGSSDNSWSIILEYASNDHRIIPITQKNIGLTKSLNVGIRNSRGKYIARMDVDDISYQNRLEKQYRFLNENRECVLVGGQRTIKDEIRNITYQDKLPLTSEEIREAAPKRNPFFHSLVLMKKEILISVGLYNEKFKYVGAG